MSKQLDSTKLNVFSNFNAPESAPPPSTKMNVINTTPEASYDARAQAHDIVNSNRGEIQKFLAQALQDNSLSNESNELALNKYSRITPDGRVQMMLERNFDKYNVRLNVRTAHGVAQQQAPVQTIFKSRGPVNANLALLYDTTGSYYGTSSQLVGSHAALLKQSKFGMDVGEDFYINTLRVGVGSQADRPSEGGSRGDVPFTLNSNFTRLRNYAAPMLSSYGGGDQSEAQNDALIAAVNKDNGFSWGARNVNIIALFTDTGSHSDGAYATTSDAIKALKAARVVPSPPLFAGDKRYGVDLYGGNTEPDFQKIVSAASRLAHNRGWIG